MTNAFQIKSRTRIGISTLKQKGKSFGRQTSTELFLPHILPPTNPGARKKKRKKHEQMITLNSCKIQEYKVKHFPTSYTQTENVLTYPRHKIISYKCTEFMEFSSNRQKMQLITHKKIFENGSKKKDKENGKKKKPEIV